MLENIYLLTSLVAFSCLIASFFNKKRPARLILQLVATALFGALAISSTQVERFDCESVTTLTNSTNTTYSASNNTVITYKNDIICEKNSTFDEAAVWSFAGITLIAASIAFFTALNTMSMKEED